MNRRTADDTRVLIRNSILDALRGKDSNNLAAARNARDLRNRLHDAFHDDLIDFGQHTGEIVAAAIGDAVASEDQNSTTESEMSDRILSIASTFSGERTLDSVRDETVEVNRLRLMLLVESGTSQAAHYTILGRDTFNNAYRQLEKDEAVHTETGSDGLEYLKIGPPPPPPLIVRIWRLLKGHKVISAGAFVVITIVLGLMGDFIYDLITGPAPTSESRAVPTQAPPPTPIRVPTAVPTQPPPAPAQQQVAPAAASVSVDRVALIDLYNTTNGDNWKRKNLWASERPLGEWYGVTTGANGRVIGLSLDSNGLDGEIPWSIGNLANLQTLDLGGNQLDGPIPSELGNLSNLEHLTLWQNELRGEIPARLGNLSNLKTLWLYDNQLSGPIPTNIGLLYDLQSLDLRGNRLSAQIPDGLGSLPDLRFLLLSNNMLSGSIPSDLGYLRNLEILRLSSNSAVGFSGCIPKALRNVDDHDLDSLGLPTCR